MIIEWADCSVHSRTPLTVGIRFNGMVCGEMVEVQASPQHS